MSYTKQEILESIISYQVEYGRYPARKDLGKKDGLPGKSTIYRIFGNLRNAINEAELYEKGELVPEEKQGERKSLKATSTKNGFHCPFCGNFTSNAEKYYSSLTIILTTRLVDLLETKTRPCCSDSVLDCIKKVFGKKNLTVREALKGVGKLEKYDQRFNVFTKEDVSKFNGRLKCHLCNELKDDWEITVDTSTKPYCEYICEDCLSKKRK